MSMDRHGNVWRFRVTKNGIPYTKFFEGTEAKAKQAHEAFKVDVSRNLVGTNEHMPFNELAQLVLDQYVRPNLTSNTEDLYKNSYNNHLLKYFEDTKLCKIRPLDIQKFITKLSDDGYSYNTISSNLSVLRKTFGMAVRWGFIYKNPCEFAEIPKKKKLIAEAPKRKEIMTADELRKLFDIYDNMLSKPARKHRLAFYIALGCGLRNSEIRGLTTDDIDFTNNIIKVNKQFGRYKENGEIIDGYIPPKSESSIRDVFAPDFVMAAINEYLDKLDSIPITKQLFFSKSTGKPIGRQCLSSFFTSILIKNDLPVIDFHDLRHLHATLLVNENVNIKSLSTRMGHSKIETTNIYMHSINSVDQQVASTLNAAVLNLKDYKSS